MYKVYSKSLRRQLESSEYAITAEGKILKYFLYDEIGWNTLDRHESSDIVFCLASGLKDCNDNEIYEGDIIELADGNRGVVNFADGRFYHTAETHISGLLYWHKVIGNKFENPELIKHG